MKKIFVSLIILLTVFCGYLNAETAEKVLGVKVYFNKVIRDSKERVMGGTLAREAVIKYSDMEITLPQNSEIRLYENGNIKSLTIGNQLELSTPLNKLQVSSGTLLSFDEKGVLLLNKCRLKLSGESRIKINNKEIFITKESKLFFISNVLCNFARSEFILARQTAYYLNKMDIKFKISSELKFHDNGTVKEGILDENIIYQFQALIVPFTAGYNIAFFENGKIDFSRSVVLLSEDADIKVGFQNLTFKSGSELLFYNSRKVKEGTIALNSRITIGPNHVLVLAGKTLTFDIKGRVDLEKTVIYPAEDLKLQIGKNNCLFDKDSSIEFYGNGSVKKGKLKAAGPIYVNNEFLQAAAGTLCHFDDNGTIDIYKTDITLEAPHSFKISHYNISLKKGTRLYYNIDGTIDFMKTGIIPSQNANMLIGNQKLQAKADNPITFFENGEVRSCTLAGENMLYTKVIRTNIPDNSFLQFDNNQNLLSILPGSKIKVNILNNSYIFKEEALLNLYDGGSVKEGVLGDHFFIKYGKNNIPLNQGKTLRFYENGDPIITDIKLPLDAKITASDLLVSVKKESHLYFKANRDIDFVKSNFFAGLNFTIQRDGNSFAFTEGRILTFYEDGGLKSGILKNDTPLRIGQYRVPVKAGTHCFFNEDNSFDAKNTTIKLSQEYTLPVKKNNFPLIADTELVFLIDDSLDFMETQFILAKETAVKIGDYQIPVASQNHLYFTEEGDFDLDQTEFQLAGDIDLIIHSRKLKFQGGKKLKFHETKIPKEGFLKGDLNIIIYNQNYLFYGDRVIYFNEDGQIDFEGSLLELKENITIKLGKNSLSFAKDKRLVFHDNEILKSGPIGQDDITLYFGERAVKIKGNKTLYFNESGQIDSHLTHLVIAEDLSFQMDNNIIPFMAGTRLYFDEENNLTQGVLARDMTLNIWEHEIPFKKGKKLFFYEKGNINTERTEIYLYKDTDITVGTLIIKFKKRFPIYFDKNGKVKKGRLADDVSLQIGENKIKVSNLKDISFYPDGSIKEIFVHKGIVIKYGKQSIPVNDDSFINFYHNQKIKEMELLEDTKMTIMGNPLILRRYTSILFHSNGVIAKIQLASDSPYSFNKNNLLLDRNRPVEYYNNGLLKGALIKNDIDYVINNLMFKFKGNNQVLFHRNGTLQRGTIEKNKSVNLNGNEIVISGGSSVSFYYNGAVKEVFPAYPVNIRVQQKNVTFDSGAPLFFYQDGRMSEGTLQRETLINTDKGDLLFAGGTNIKFYPTGKVQSGYLSRDTPLNVGDNRIVFSQMKEMIFHKNGLIKQGHVAERFQYLSVNNYKILVRAGDWVYLPNPEKRIFYIININGKVRYKTPFFIGGAWINLPVKTKVAFQGDDTVFKVFTPSQDIYINEQLLASAEIEIKYDELENRIKTIQ